LNDDYFFGAAGEASCSMHVLQARAPSIASRPHSPFL
jgi:hypothetical protein